MNRTTKALSRKYSDAQRKRSRLYGGIGALLLALAVLGWWSNSSLAQTPVTPDAPAEVNAAAFAASEDPDRPVFVPGELLVGVRTDHSVQTASAFSAAGFSVDETLTQTEDDATVTQIVSVPAGEELQAAQEIAAQPGVVYVEPNSYVWAAQEVESAAATASVPAAYTPNDKFYAADQWNMQRINMARAWQLAFDSGYFAPPATNIVVAVIDSGVDPAHPEFAGRLLPGKNYVNTMPGENGNPVPAEMRDDYGHGTHVTGIIAAALNDGKGVAGVAPMVMIDPRRVLGSTGGGTIANVARAIEESADDGAHIINLSLVVASYSQTLANAVTYASDAGALVVAAAGNAGVSSVYYPAALPEAIAVGALSYWDTPTSYSNHGPEMDIAAPGGDASRPVFSTWPRPSSFPETGGEQYAYRCFNSWQTFKQDGAGHYCHNYGTSFASPEVAGVAALLMALDPDLNAEQVRAILLNTAIPLPDYNSNYVGAGKLDAYAAVRALLPASVKLTPSGYYANIAPSTQPFTFTVRIENPSIETASWQANLILNTLPVTAEAQPFALDATDWLSLSSGVARAQNGSASYGKPGFLTFAVNPAALTSGVNSSRLTVNAETAEGETSLASDFTILGGIAELRRWLPIIMREHAGGGTVPPVPQSAASAESPAEPTAIETESATYAWEVPASVASTQQLTFTTTSLSVALPYTVTLGGQKYTRLQVFEDGFVTLPDQIPTGNPAQNRCLPQSDWFGDAVYGWWANLDSHTTDAKVTLFRTAANRVVIQYENMASVGVSRPYKASFQIVLDQAGIVRLNYRDLPAVVGKPALATIGVQSSDGRFFSEIACTTALLTLGTPPSAGESIVIRPVDQY